LSIPLHRKALAGCTWSGLFGLGGSEIWAQMPVYFELSHSGQPCPVSYLMYIKIMIVIWKYPVYIK